MNKVDKVDNFAELKRCINECNAIDKKENKCHHSCYDTYSKNIKKIKKIAIKNINPSGAFPPFS
jgi:hypothetical protein